MLVVEQQHVVEQLAAHSADEALRDCVHLLAREPPSGLPSRDIDESAHGTRFAMYRTMHATRRRAHDKPPPVPDASAIDAAVTAVLGAPLAASESAAAGFQRKERELGAIFAGLSLHESRVYLARLSSPRPDDAVATAFARLIVERRSRLLAFLADAPRRAWLAERR